MSEKMHAALRELRRGVEVVPDEPNDGARRARIAGRVTSLQRELVRQDQRRHRFVGLLAAAALLGGLVFWYARAENVAKVVTAPHGVWVNVVSGQLGLREGDAVAPLGAGELNLPADGVVVVEHETARLTLTSRAALELAPASELGLRVSASRGPGRKESVKLFKGRVDLDVPKLGEHDGLAVETADALVEVRGTRFSVQLIERPSLPSLTQVQVTEGRVWIHTPSGVQELVANQSWRSTPARAPAAVERATPAPPAAAVEPAPRKPAVARSSEPAAPGALDASELSEQNRLLEAAGLAKENGMPELALERLDRLLESHPGAELAHNARVERFRLLAQLGRREAARGAAREYLERHPNGFARKEARLLLEAPLSQGAPGDPR